MILLLTLRAQSFFFSKFFPFPTLVSLLYIFLWPLTFSTPNLSPFLTLSTTYTNLLTGTQLGQTKRPRYMLAPATPKILSYIAREMSQLPTRLRGQRGGCAPFKPPLTGGHPPLKFTRRKTVNFFSHFHWLPITNICHIYVTAVL